MFPVVGFGMSPGIKCSVINFQPILRHNTKINIDMFGAMIPPEMTLIPNTQMSAVAI